jgi:hypothetical protein
MSRWGPRCPPLCAFWDDARSWFGPNEPQVGEGEVVVQAEGILMPPRRLRMTFLRYPLWMDIYGFD